MWVVLEIIYSWRNQAWGRGAGGRGAGGGGRRLPLDRQEVLHPKAVIRVSQKIKWRECVRQLKGCRCEEPSGVWLSQD